MIKEELHARGELVDACFEDKDSVNGALQSTYMDLYNSGT